MSSESPPGGGQRRLRHELRTPLNQIIGYSELVSEELADIGQDQLVTDLQKITFAARNMLQMVDHLFESGLVKQDATVEHAAPEAPPTAQPAALTVVRNDSFGAGRSLLVVDDDPRNAEFLARQLERRGFAVTVASSGPEALSSISARAFDLVVLDVMMPGMSGLEVLRRVRATTSAAELPVIMATALDQSGDVVEALRLGANDYVTKPLDLPVVLARLENQLDLKRAREQVQQLAHDLDARNRLIRSAFGRFMSEEVVKTILETPEGLELGGTRREVTILMSDLRGFTAAADRMDPEQVMRLLNDYLGTMVEVVDRHRGTIIEFIGDAILVLFGAPLSAQDDARRAVACAIDMQRAMGAINDGLLQRGLPKLEMGIALNTGEVIVGNIGSFKRSKYGVVGRHVNLTARVETFGVGGQILATAATLAAAGSDVLTGTRLSFNAKGFAEPVEVAEIRGLESAGLHVPSVEEVFTELSPALPVEVRALEGKQLSAEALSARLVRAGPTGGVLKGQLPLGVFSDLRLRLTERSGAVLEEDVYAKVLESSAAGLRIRFTSLPPRAAALLKKLGA